MHRAIKVRNMTENVYNPILGLLWQWASIQAHHTAASYSPEVF